MNTLRDYVTHYYTEHNYNCAETLIHACNDYYHLNLHEEDMIMMAGFGGGMFVGSTCGALIGSVAALSKLIVTTKAHETANIRPSIQACYRNFNKELGATDCAHVKAVHHSKETRCLPTVLKACDALEETIKQLEIEAAK